MLSDFPILSDLFYRIKSMCGYDVTRTYLIINDRCRYNSGFWCRDNKGNSTGTDTFGLSCFPYTLTDSVLNTYCNLQVQNTIPTFEPTNKSIISKVSFISGVIEWKVSAILHELFYSVADGSLLNDYVFFASFSSLAMNHLDFYHLLKQFHSPLEVLQTFLQVHAPKLAKF